MANSPRQPDPRGHQAAFPAFYPVLDIDVAAARKLDPLVVLDAWLDAGVRLVQLRAKQMSGSAFLEIATRCAERTSAAGASFIVNDRVDVARLCGATGVHLGQDDLPPEAARTLLPVPALVGWSTHGDGQMLASNSMPIDYVAIGPVFDTRSKLRPDPVVGLDGVASAVSLSAGRPVVAIGGITLETARDVIEAGASCVAVIGDVMHHDAGARARAFIDRLAR